MKWFDCRRCGMASHAKPFSDRAEEELCVFCYKKMGKPKSGIKNKHTKELQYWR